MNKLQTNAGSFRTTTKLIFVALLCLTSFRGIAQIPLLNSYTSASAVLFLDFDGHTVDNTPWNYNGPIYCGPSGLNNTQITEIFNRVSEDYRPFNINVTTDSLKFLAAQPDRRMRVVLTVTSDWYGAAGGVAFNSSFTWGDGSPCFVFTALLNNNVKNISEAASHEAGHTLGLQHQSVYDNNCVKVSDYNYGNGSGEIGWAPIMGVGYYRNLTLWHNGPNPFGCNNFQSDLDIITTNNGFGFRPDDHGNNIGTATTVSLSGNQFTFSGVIERNTDYDFMKMNMPLKGRFELVAVPYNVGTGNAGSDLDMQVSLFSASGQLIKVYNPDNLLNSVIDSVLDAGTYYIKVEGRGNAYAPDYASLGSYSLQGRITAGILPLNRLELKGRVENSKHLLNWIVEADELVTGQILEYSSDGRNFSEMKRFDPAERQFVYVPFLNTTVFYRMRVRLSNDEQYVTNIIALRQANEAAPHLLGNIINNGSLQIQTPGICQYAVYDISGRAMGRGEIAKGTSSIRVSGYSKGMYLAEFIMGGAKYTERFIIQ